MESLAHFSKSTRRIETTKHVPKLFPQTLKKRLRKHVLIMKLFNPNPKCLPVIIWSLQWSIVNAMASECIEYVLSHGSTNWSYKIVLQIIRHINTRYKIKYTRCTKYVVIVFDTLNLYRELSNCSCSLLKQPQRYIMRSHDLSKFDFSLHTWRGVRY